MYIFTVPNNRLVKALEKADQFMPISKAASEPNNLLYLTDTVFTEIQFSANSNLQESKSLLLAIAKRNLWRLSGPSRTGLKSL
jgi:hypothetical protein